MMGSVPTVLVEVLGGVVQAVYVKGLPEGTQLCIVDWDGATVDPDWGEHGVDGEDQFAGEPSDETKAVFEKWMGRPW